MNMVIIIIWIIAIGFLVVFIYDYLIPFIKRKFLWFRVSKLLRKVAKNNKGKAKNKLLELEKEVKEFNKHEKL